MKKILYPIMFLTFFSASAQTAQNISFTDLDGTTHDLYTYLDSGYTVILDFSYELCGPCYEWTIYIGHDLWEEHGPEGDNTLRMFHFDVYPETDESVESYTQEWGVKYSVTNLPDMNTLLSFLKMDIRQSMLFVLINLIQKQGVTVTLFLFSRLNIF